MRLQKFLAQAGIASRRKCEELISQGKVSINGVVVTTLGTMVSETDQVYFEGKEVKLNHTTSVYYILHKPVGYVTTVSDEKGRATVLDIMKQIPHRIFPIGRLDYQTSGLLLLTNDGDLTYKITHPKHHIDKTYIAKVKGNVSNPAIKKLCVGIQIEDYTTSPAKVKRLTTTSNTTTLSITIHEGRNRQVRKMCSAIGHEVLSLKRIAIGELDLGDLKVGKYRELTPKELAYLTKEVNRV